MPSIPTEVQLSSKLDRALVDIYRGWDRLERLRYNNPIIDFDLAPTAEPGSVASREDVVRELEHLLKEAEYVGAPARPLVVARLRASITYLRALLGERLSLKEYISNTLGIQVKRFSGEQLAVQRSRLRVGGLSVREGSLETVLSFFHLEDWNKRKLPRQFSHFREKWVPEFLFNMNLDLKDYEIAVEFAWEDAYWKNWISGDLSQRRMELKINLHERHVWYQGSAEALAVHEFCGHAVQMASWHSRLEAGRLPSFMGILTVHFPDQFLLEGVAESLAFFLPLAVGSAHLESKTAFLRDLHFYRLLVLNNLHIIANDESKEEALDYGREWLPFVEEDVLRREIRDRCDHPLFRGYQYVYGVGAARFVDAFRLLGEKGGWELLRLVYARPFTAAQLDGAVESLMRGEAR